MAKHGEGGGGRRAWWPDPALRFEGSSPAPAEAVYDLLSDLRAHLDWAGARQLETTRLLTLEAPEGPAGVGTEFFSTGSDGKVARWSDRSVVTEATRPEVFEFVTEGRRQGKPGSAPWAFTAVNRYAIAAEGGGSRVTFTQQITRLDGPPRILRLPGMGRLMFRMASRYMRRGFDGLLASAQERVGVA